MHRFDVFVLSNESYCFCGVRTVAFRDHSVYTLKIRSVSHLRVRERCFPPLCSGTGGPDVRRICLVISLADLPRFYGATVDWEAALGPALAPESDR